MTVAVEQVMLASPEDTAALEQLIRRWGADRIAKLALLYRVEGEYEDGSRERSRAAVHDLLSRHGLDRRAEMVTTVGCEGLSTPFGIVLAELGGAAPAAERAASTERRLAIGLARGNPPSELVIDKASFAADVAGLVGTAIKHGGMIATDVVTVIVNTPQPSTGDKAERGRKARAVAALGAGIAIGEIKPDSVTDAALLTRPDLYTPRVQTFAGPTVKQIEVIVLGNRTGIGGHFTACSTVTDDLMDLRPIKRMLVAASMTLDADGELREPERVAALLLKSSVPPGGDIKGRRTMLFAPGLPVEKHVRAAQSGLVAGLLGTSCALNTYDPVHQCPVGGSAVCALVRQT